MLPNKNIIQFLNDIKLFGARFTLTELSYFDNTLEIQAPRELLFEMRLRNKTSSAVIRLEPISREEEEEEEEERAKSKNTHRGNVNHLAAS